MAARNYIIGSAQSATGKVNDTLQMVLTISIVAVIGIIIWNVIKAAKAGSKLVGDAIGDGIVAQQTGIPVSRQNALRQIASDAHIAIRGSKGFFGTYWQGDEDEDVFINALNELRTVAEVKLFSTYYKNIDGKSVRKDAMEYLNNTERSRINSVVFQNLG